MSRHRAAFAIAVLALFASSCDRQEERSASAKEAGAAVEELRGLVDELDGLGEKMRAFEDKLFDSSGRRAAVPPEVEDIQLRISKTREKAQRQVQTIKPDLDRKIADAPKDAGLLEVRSRFRETLGDIEEALEDLDAALALLPKDDSIRARRPGLLRRLGRYEQARAACAELLKEKADHPVAIATDGLCLYALDQYPEAITRLGEAEGHKGRLEPSLAREVTRTLEAAKVKRAEWDIEQQKRAAEAKANDLPRVKLVTSKGDIIIELFENEAPNAVANFIDLCDKKFFDGTTFHRVIPDFMVQGGDPNSKDKNPNNDGSGGPGYQFPDEFPADHRRHFRGVLSLANHGKDTNGSQFFITHRPAEHLDGKHVVFGRVTDGMAVVDSIRKGDELKSTEILRKRDHAYRPVY